MSSKLVVEIWHCEYGDASTILVLMALADEANDKGEYSADLDTIARKARQSSRNCRYLLRKLEELQIIERFEARGRSHTNSYRIHIDNLKNLQPLHILEENLQPLQHLPVLENLQKVQPLQVLDSPFPSDSPSLLRQDPTQKEEPPIIPQESETDKRLTKAMIQPNTNYTPGFNKAWASYPRKEKKVEAFTIWRTRELEFRSEEIVQKLQRLRQTLWAKKEVQYIPLPTTWFNQACYEDELVSLDVFSQPLSRSEQRRAEKQAEMDRFVNGGHYEEPTGSRAFQDGDGSIIDVTEYRVHD